MTLTIKEGVATCCSTCALKCNAETGLSRCKRCYQFYCSTCLPIHVEWKGCEQASERHLNVLRRDGLL